MLVKLTSKNRITIPKEVLSNLPKVQHFDVEYRDGAIVLKPVKVFTTDLRGFREKMKALGLAQDCVKEAMKWAREK